MDFGADDEDFGRATLTSEKTLRAAAGRTASGLWAWMRRC
jgi:hypothetical protein